MCVCVGWGGEGGEVRDEEQSAECTDIVEDGEEEKTFKCKDFRTPCLVPEKSLSHFYGNRWRRRNEDNNNRDEGMMVKERTSREGNNEGI